MSGLILLCLGLISCSPSVDPVPDNSQQPETSSNPESPAQPGTPQTPVVPQRNPGIVISYDDDSAFSGKDLSFTIAFTDYDSNPTAVDVFIENTSTAYASNVSINSNKVTVTVPASFSAKTITFYVKAGEVESNHLSLKYGYLVTVDQCLDFLNSITSSDVVLVRVTGSYDDFLSNVCTSTSPLKNENLRINLDLSKISEGTYVYANCEGYVSLVEIKLPEFISFIATDGFRECTNLENITFPHSCTINQNAFWNCTSLKTIQIPDNVTCINTFTFCRCSSLKSVIIPNTVTQINSYAFKNCSKLESIVLPPSLTIINADIFNGCEQLKEIIIPTGVTQIKRGAFCLCQRLSRITIPNTVTQIEQQAFMGCYKKYYSNINRSLTIPSSVNSIGVNAFKSCQYLESVTFENKTGWKAGDTDISESQLANPETAATLLKTTYTDVAWTRTAN